VIRVDALWLSVAPLDMRAGTDTILAQVVQVFGEARPHHAYLFANRRGTRLKVLVHDGQGIWLACRRLNQGRFRWGEGNGIADTLAVPFRRPGARAALAAAKR
jgi:transposase